MKLQTALAALHKGAWSGATAYIAADIVTSGGSSYICILAHTNQVPPNATYWAVIADKGAAGSNGSNGSAGTNGTDGAFGGALTIEYTFSTTTTDSDPGSGVLRLSNATQASSTVIRADLLDINVTDWTTALDSFDDSTSTIKGHIRLVKKTDASKWLTFSVSALATPSGYRNITVVNTGSSASSPFANADDILLHFSRTGDKGDAGSAAAAGSILQSTFPSGVDSIPLSATRIGTFGYALNDGTFWLGTGSEASRQIRIPADGSLSKFGVRVHGGDQPSSGSLVLTIRKNAADTALVITIPLSSTAGDYADNVNSVSVLQGDLISIKAVNNATAASAVMKQIGCIFVPA